jgi:hypothetical protein
MCGENDCRHLAAEVPQGEVYSHFILFAQRRSLRFSATACVVGDEFTLFSRGRSGRALCINDMAIFAIVQAQAVSTQRTNAPKSTAIPFEPTYQSR